MAGGAFLPYSGPSMLTALQTSCLYSIRESLTVLLFNIISLHCTLLQVAGMFQNQVAVVAIAKSGKKSSQGDKVGRVGEAGRL